MGGLGTEKRVTDLNSATAFSRISGHEHRTLHSLPSSRPGPPPDSRPHRKAIRASIELFFRWIKGHLRIKHYYGTSPNAVKTQIWIAVSTYLIIAILHKQLNLPGTLHRTLQLLSVHPFEKVTLNALLMETDHRTFINSDHNQLNLF